MKKPVFFSILCLCLGLFSCSQKEASEAVPSVVADGPLEYTLEDLSGTVLIQSADETQPEPAEEEQVVQAGDEIITREGSEASLTLNETTLVHLSENSDVKVDQLARNQTQGFTSRLSLAAGKILSEVEKLSQSNSVFEISSGGVVCGVRGTSFEVEKQDADIQTTTYNGSVAVQKDNNTQTVEANQHGDFSVGQGAFLSKRELTPEEKARYESWKTKLAFLREKTRGRLEFLRSLDRLPSGERQKMLEQLNGVKGKDRLKTLRQIMAGGADQGNHPGGNQGPGANLKTEAEKQEAAPEEHPNRAEPSGEQRQERPKDVPPKVRERTH